MTPNSTSQSATLRPVESAKAPSVGLPRRVTLDRRWQTTVYMDGFNLYYSALRGSPYEWLDVEAISRRLLPKDDINQIRYFTAWITARPDDPQQAQRQETYLRALRTLPLVSIHWRCGRLGGWRPS